MMGRVKKPMIATVNRSFFKEVVGSMPLHQRVDNGESISLRKMEIAVEDKNRIKLDNLFVKGLVWRLVEVFFNPTMVDKAITAIQRDEDIKAVSLDGRKGEEEMRLVGRDECTRIFLEEDLVLLMMHEDQGVSDSLISYFESSLTQETSTFFCPEVGPLTWCIDEANRDLGPSLHDRSPSLFKMCSNVMGCEEP